MDIEFVRSRFVKHFDGKTGNIYASPGRINLIGEHTDYNGGFVFPGAVEQGIMAEIRPNGQKTCNVYSIDLKDMVHFTIDDPKGPSATWARYIYGIVQEMRALGVDVKPFNAAFAGDVPLGAGMSSSAALESCFAFALNDLFGDNKVSKWDLVLAGQATEHKYIGVNCGIMDQFASVFGKKGKLMRLDCRSREFEYFPWEPKGYKLVLLNSKVKHELKGSPYNDRRNSCENVVKALGQQFPDKKFETLRDADWDELEAVKDKVSAEDYKRAHFVLGEKDRVLAVCDALQAGDYETVGQKCTRPITDSAKSMRSRAKNLISSTMLPKSVASPAAVSWAVASVVARSILSKTKSMINSSLRLRRTSKQHMTTNPSSSM